MPPSPFSVLVVCSANICRSPAAAARLRAVLPADLPVTVTSAGTAALTGHGVDLAVDAALRETGVNVGPHTARQATSDLVAASDLVLAAAVSHRDAALALDPASRDRTFTLREFARLGAALGPLPQPAPDSLRRRVAEVAAQRSEVGPVPPGLDDVGDPFGAPFREVQRCVAVIGAAVDGCVTALGLSVRRQG